jgi:hypothetical protein
LQLLMQLSSQKKLIQQVLEFSAHRYFHMFSIQWIFKSFYMIRWKDVWCVDKAGPNGQRNKCSRCKIDLVCLLQLEFRLLKKYQVAYLSCLFILWISDICKVNYWSLIYLECSCFPLFRFLREEPIGCRILGLESSTARKQKLIGRLTWFQRGKKKGNILKPVLTTLI